MLAAGGATITFPTILLASPRMHNRIVREQLDTELRLHHRLIMPGHFTQGAAARYGHMKRNPMYIRNKLRRYRTAIDLVRTGATKSAVLGNRTITISGAASSETLRGQLVMRLPFGGGTGVQFNDQDYERLAQTLARGTDKNGRPLSASQILSITRKLQNRDNTRGKTGVTPAQMIKELRAVTKDEAEAVTRRMGQGYVNRIKAMAKPHLAAGVPRSMLQ